MPKVLVPEEQERPSESSTETLIPSPARMVLPGAGTAVAETYTSETASSSRL